MSIHIIIFKHEAEFPIRRYEIFPIAPSPIVNSYQQCPIILCGQLYEKMLGIMRIIRYLYSVWSFIIIFGSLPGRFFKELWNDGRSRILNISICVEVDVGNKVKISYDQAQS